MLREVAVLGRLELCDVSIAGKIRVAPQLANIKRIMVHTSIIINQTYLYQWYAIQTDEYFWWIPNHNNPYNRNADT